MAYIHTTAPRLRGGRAAATSAPDNAVGESIIADNCLESRADSLLYGPRQAPRYSETSTADLARRIAERKMMEMLMIANEGIGGE